MKKFTATYKVGSSEIVLGKFKTEALAWNALDEYCDKLLLDIPDDKKIDFKQDFDDNCFVEFEYWVD